MKIIYSSEVEKQIRKLPKVELKKIFRKIELLSKERDCGKALVGEFKGLKSLRAWPYRIVYREDKDMITIFLISHRQGVYKK